MSRIDELIVEFCPHGVEETVLSDVCDILRGQRVTKAQLLSEGKYPVISGGVTPMGYLDEFNRDENSITIAQYGTAGFVNFQKQKFWANDVCYTLLPGPKVITQYLFYYLLSLQELLYSLKIDAVPAHLPQNRLKMVKVIVPPLTIQEEIVRILDTFTALETELEAELEARTRQYEFYRDALLNFDPQNPHPLRPARLNELIQTLCPDGVDYKPLREICNRHKGTPITAAEMKKLNTPNAPIRIFAGGNTIADVNYGDIPEKDVINRTAIIVKSRGYIGFEFCEQPFSHKNEMWSYSAKSKNIDLKFVYYYLKINETFFQERAIQGKLPQISIPVTDNFLVPIPPLPVQEEIVIILDRFDALVNDLKDGLPAEIAARRKQYEFYRDRLLTFKPLENTN